MDGSQYKLSSMNEDVDSCGGISEGIIASVDGVNKIYRALNKLDLLSVASNVLKNSLILCSLNLNKLKVSKIKRYAFLINYLSTALIV